MTSRILIAEDDPAIGTLLQVLLRKQGYEVHLVRDGEQVLATLTKEEFDVIVLDLMMPKVSGYDVINVLREQRAELLERIIVVSAMPAAMKAPPPNVAAFFAKPFDLQMFLDQVRQLASPPSTRHEPADENPP